MKIQSTRFGEIEFDAAALISFPEGVLGFPDDVSYLLLENKASTAPLNWLQSAQNPELAFIVVDPSILAKSYAVKLDADTSRMIGTQDPSQCACMAIVNVPKGAHERMTANLRAPLVVNSGRRIGRQIVIGNQSFSIREPLGSAGAGAGIGAPRRESKFSNFNSSNGRLSAFPSDAVNRVTQNPG